MTTSRRRRRLLPRLFVIGIVAVSLAFLAGTVAVWFDIGGMRGHAAGLVERVALAVNPPPDRPIEEELITPRPTGVAIATPVPTATPTLAPGQTAAPTPVPTPAPKREPVDVNIITKPKQHFIAEVDHEWCAVAATQMVLAWHDAAPLTEAFQIQLANRVGEWESSRDSKNGGWGPAAMTKALDAYGVSGYEVRIYETRQDAMTDAARAIETTGSPVILLTWRGAHSWVMTGFT